MLLIKILCVGKTRKYWCRRYYWWQWTAYIGVDLDGHFKIPDCWYFLWGNTILPFLAISIQTVARTVARVDWNTPVREIFNQVGWLSVHQLAFYHSVLLVYKVKSSQQPQYLSNMFNWSYRYNTRQADRGQIRLEGRPRLEITSSSFKWRAARQFNQLPADILSSKTIKTFKGRVKSWIRENIEF